MPLSVCIGPGVNFIDIKKLALLFFSCSLFQGILLNTVAGCTGAGSEKVGRIRLLISLHWIASLHPRIRFALKRKKIKIKEKEFLVGRRVGMSPSQRIYRAHTQSQREFRSKNVDKKKQAEMKIRGKRSQKSQKSGSKHTWNSHTGTKRKDIVSIL
jgi:hypothetical protein